MREITDALARAGYSPPNGGRRFYIRPDWRRSN